MSVDEVVFVVPFLASIVTITVALTVMTVVFHFMGRAKTSTKQPPQDDTEGCLDVEL